MHYEVGESEAKRKATAFYGIHGPWSKHKTARCVVRWAGKADPNAPVSWHHLDERKPRWWHYLNIVPISPDLNQAIEVRRFKGLPDELTPSSLKLTARSHFREGRFALGYACARLGCFLTVPHRGDAALGVGINEEMCVEFACFSLLNLRPLSAVSFAEDTLRRSVLPILSHPANRKRIQARTKGRLVIDIGSYFRDFGMGKESIRCCDLAERYIELENAMTGEITAEDEVLQARIAQHRGIAYAQLGQFGKAQSWLRRAPLCHNK